MRGRDVIDVDTDPAEALHDRLRRLLRLGVPILGVMLIAGALAGTAYYSYTVNRRDAPKNPLDREKARISEV